MLLGVVKKGGINLKILEDVNNKVGAHDIKHQCWDLDGVEYLRVGLPVGDYILVNEKVADVLDRKAKRGIPVKKMDLLGSYNVCVDSKYGLEEVSGNICGKSHARFRDELVLAQNNGIRLVVLIENKEGIKEVRDVFKWHNPRMRRYNKIKWMKEQGKWENVPLPSKPPTSGETLAKAMLSMQLKYGVEFRFCTPGESAKKIIEILTEE